MGSVSSGDKMASSDPELAQGLSLTRYSFCPLSLPASVSQFVLFFSFKPGLLSHNHGLLDSISFPWSFWYCILLFPLCSSELMARPILLSLKLLPRGKSS